MSSGSPTTSNIDYPPIPDTIEQAVLEGTEWRKSSDHYKWWHGWRYLQIKERWPEGLDHEQYAASVGLGRNEFRKMYKTARVFKPEHVNAFPGLPFTFWTIVADLGETDLEEALSLIENAYDTPGLTIGQFEQLVNPYRVSNEVLPPLYLLGHLITPVVRQMERGRRVLSVQVELDLDLENWTEKFQGYPLIGKPVEVIIRMPKSAAL